MTTNVQRIIFAVVTLLSTATYAFSQEQSKRLNDFNDSDRRLINCETYSVDIDRMVSVASELIKQSDFIILIARLGDGERNREFNRRRLHNVEEKLKADGVEEKKIIIAEGERVKGLGRVEIYIGGRMVESLRAKRNKDICVECCGDDERYYPYKAKLNSKRQK